MLKLILGASGSGKTTLLYERITARARAGQKSILLVPEQFTSSTEARIYHTLGDALSGMVESFSFTSLAESILESVGGAAVETLTDAGRAVLVRRAMAQLGGNVKYYYNHRRSAAFCQLAAETIDELKSAGLSGEELARLAKSCGSGSEKLAELALIFQGYEALLPATGMDPSDRILIAARQLESAMAAGEAPDFLDGCAIFMDEFDTFNAPKKRLMASLLRAQPEVTVALCADDLSITGGDLSLFSGAKRVALDLRQLAAKNNIPVAAPELLREDRRHAPGSGLAALAQLLVSDDCPAQHTDDITLYAAESREDEARAAAAAIRGLMRKGVRCGQIAVVCREADTYRAAVRYEFRMADIPLYCDEPTSPEFSAPACAVRALLGLLRGRDWSENMTALAKTGLCALDERTVCALENYVYTWGPKKAEWSVKFDRSPRGFGDESRLTDEEKEDRDLAEAARGFLMQAVEPLCRRAAEPNMDAAALSRQLYLCLKALGAEEKQGDAVAALRRRRGIPAAEEAAREWNVVMGLLDQMAKLLGAENTRAEDYADLFELLVRSSDLGHIPQTLDAVIFTSAGKMRLAAPDYVFVLGLAEGEFPRAPGDTGLLTHADRDALMAQNVELPDCFENRMVREQVAFYKALTAPAKGLWLSWPEGMGAAVTAQVDQIDRLLSPAVPALALEDAAATPAAALDALGSVWGSGSVEKASLFAALEQCGGPAAEKLGMLRRIAAMEPRRVTELARMAEVLGSELFISPSQLEKYYSCRYGYFLKYVLGLSPRKKAEMSPDQSGTLMHWVLQMALEPNPEANSYQKLKPAPFEQLTDAQLAELTKALVEEYRRLYLPEESARFSYLLSRITRSLVGLLCYLRDEQRESAFVPVACEEKIGKNGSLPPQTYRLADGHTVQVIGTIDRVDAWTDAEGEEWVRVVDYKTGSKKFSLNEVYCGLDCQMLLYLFTLTRDESGRFTGTKPAGVLYLLADPAPLSAVRSVAAKPLGFTLEGLVSDRSAVYDAMDPAHSGRFVPFGFKNDAPNPLQKKRLADDAKFERIEKHLDALVTGMGDGLYAGDVAAEPLCSQGTPCEWCDYSFICCHEDGVNERRPEAPADPFGAEEAEAAPGRGGGDATGEMAGKASAAGDAVNETADKAPAAGDTTKQAKATAGKGTDEEAEQ